MPSRTRRAAPRTRREEETRRLRGHAGFPEEHGARVRPQVHGAEHRMALVVMKVVLKVMVGEGEGNQQGGWGEVAVVGVREDVVRAVAEERDGGRAPTHQSLTVVTTSTRIRKSRGDCRVPHHARPACYNPRAHQQRRCGACRRCNGPEGPRCQVTNFIRCSGAQ
ncbi:unnamed protein product [Lampetra fluviatilis]